MKKLFFTAFSIFLILLFFSCEKESYLIEKNNVLNLENVNNPDNSNRTAISEETMNFMRRMEWVSFITAKILYDDTTNSYRDIFLTYSSMNNDLIKVEELIGDSPDATFGNFKNDFITLFEYYKNLPPTGINGCPDENDDKPGRTAIEHQTFQEFVDFLVVDNCVELFFPNSLDFSSSQQNIQVTSIAHPLIDTNQNYGYHRGYIPACGGMINSTRIWVTQSYVQNNMNIILSRPFKTIFGKQQQQLNPCSYSEYDFDFTSFLNQ